MVDFAKIQKIHEKNLYLDTCSVYEYETIRDSHGAVKTVRKEEPKYKDIPCKVSFSLRTWDSFYHNAIDVTNYEKQPRLFINLQFSINTGDYIIATKRNPATGEKTFIYEGQAGMPQLLAHHQEIPLHITSYI